MFTEDLDQFFDTNDFAVQAVFSTGGGLTVNAIFNEPSTAVSLYDTQVEAGVPFLTAIAADVSSVAPGDTVEVNSSTYTVHRIEKIEDGKIVNIYLA